MIEHYAAQYAAEGGPGVSLPTVDQAHALDAGIALVYVGGDRGWLLIDGQGQVYAEAVDPGELTGWLSEFTTALGEMHARGEI